MTAPDRQPPHVCIGCGACCTHYRVAFHWSETTACDGGWVPVELTAPLRQHEVVMRGTASAPVHCIALTGTVGQDRRCGIHGRHPSCCREVQVGDRQCRAARAAEGMPALDDAMITLARLTMTPAGRALRDGAVAPASNDPDVDPPIDPPTDTPRAA